MSWASGLLRLCVLVGAALLAACFESGTQAQSPQSLIRANSAVLKGNPPAVCAAVSGPRMEGTIRYEDKYYGYDGDGFIFPYPSYTNKPVRYARVDLVAADGTRIKQTETNGEGGYLFESVPPDARVCVRAESERKLELDRPAKVTVKGYTEQFNVRLVRSTQDILIPEHSAGSIFNILDVYIAASEFIYHLSGKSQPQKDLNVFLEEPTERCPKAIPVLDTITPVAVSVPAYTSVVPL